MPLLSTPIEFNHLASCHTVCIDCTMIAEKSWWLLYPNNGSKCMAAMWRQTNHNSFR